MSKSGKNSGFSSKGLTVGQLGENYAKHAIKNFKNFNPLSISNLPTFVTDKLNSQQRLAAKSSPASIVKETDKAVQIQYKTSYGNVNLWAPKSVVKTKSELKKQKQKQLKNTYINSRYSSYLKDLAEKNNVKIGNLSSWEKITKKLKSKGVKVLNKDSFSETKG